MNYNDDVGLILSAIRFSAEKHRDQRRKDALRSPYINHPIAVVEMLWSPGGVRDAVTLLAAILHDTIEDTGTGPDEIRSRFGEEVLALVLEVTDDKSLPKERRKLLQIETASHKSSKAKLIKLADIICNVGDLVCSPPHDWTLQRQQEYLLWTEKVVKGLRGTDPALEDRYDEEIAHGRKALGITA
jgi:guanosine-3',5'-bis(diphosphate) 3'-pyrophosphohydrolase